MGTKIATCCYCGTRAALVLRGEGRHELSCASCGAPLHLMKNLPVDALRHHVPAPATGPATGPAPRNRPVPPQIDWSRAVQGIAAVGLKGARKPKKRKSTMRWLAREIRDLVEDVFD
jgi:hypothetical protein